MKTLLSLTSRTFEKNRVRVFFEGTVERTPITTSNKITIIECKKLAVEVCRRALAALSMAIAMQAPALAQNKDPGTVTITLVPSSTADAERLSEALKNGIEGGVVTSITTAEALGNKTLKVGDTVVSYKTIGEMEPVERNKLLGKLDPNTQADLQRYFELMKGAQSSTLVAISDSNKGEGQVAKYKGNDGTEKEITFGELARMNGGEKDAIIEGLSDTDFAAYEKYIDGIKLAANQEERELEKGILAANQRVDEKREVKQAANQRVDEKREVKQAANQRVDEKREDLIMKYTIYIANMEQGMSGDQVILTRIIGADFVPKDLKERAEKILKSKFQLVAGI